MPSSTRITHRRSVFAVSACLATLLGSVANAATITVDDDGDGPPQANVCTLRSAVAAANTDAAVGGCTAGDDADVIVFERGVLDVVLTEGQLVVAGDLTLRGTARVTIRRDAGTPPARILDATDANATLTLDRIALRDGYTTAGLINGRGAGIRSVGDVVLIDSVVGGNRTEGEGASGGGINMPAATVTLIRSEVSDNRTEGDSAEGSGIVASVLVMEHSLVRGNVASGDDVSGGGVFVDHATITDSTIADNAATGAGAINGGGVYAMQSLSVERSLVTGNAVTITATDAAGGGLACACHVQVLNSTVSGNSAAVGGGVVAPILTVYSSTFTDNIAADGSSGGIALLQVNGASQFDISSSIVHGNTGDIGSPLGFALVEGSHNVVGTAATPFVFMPEDTRSCDPALEALADNGGETWTHALGAGSCALDTGDNPGGYATDQRGAPRTSGTATDVGAFEVLPTAIFLDGFE